MLRRTFLLPDGSRVERQVRQGGPGSAERWSVKHETLGSWPDVPVARTYDGRDGQAGDRGRGATCRNGREERAGSSAWLRQASSSKPQVEERTGAKHNDLKVVGEVGHNAESWTVLLGGVGRMVDEVKGGGRRVDGALKKCLRSPLQPNPRCGPSWRFAGGG